jgi:hypothetical protein
MQKKYICILKSLFKIKSFKFEFQSQQTNWKINLNLPDKTDCWRPTEILRPFQGLKKKNYQKFSWKGKPFELINEKNKETRKFLSFRNNLSWNFIRRQVFPIRFPKSIPWKFKSRKVVLPKRKIISKNKFFFLSYWSDPIEFALFVPILVLSSCGRNNVNSNYYIRYIMFCVTIDKENRKLSQSIIELALLEIDVGIFCGVYRAKRLLDNLLLFVTLRFLHWNLLLKNVQWLRFATPELYYTFPRDRRGSQIPRVGNFYRGSGLKWGPGECTLSNFGHISLTWDLKSVKFFFSFLC